MHLSIALQILVGLILAGIMLSVLRTLIRHETVHAWETGLLYRDGRFVRALSAGRYHFLDPTRRVLVARVATGQRQERIGPIDVISQDRFAFRLHLAVRWTAPDPRALYEAEQATPGFGATPGLLDGVAAAALAELGTHGLDDAVADPAGIGAAIATRMHGMVPHVTILSATIVRIELPPETRRMLTEAERARREGLAQLERARGEQAALRSLANAARLIRDNPELANLRLLQTIESSKGPTTIVVGDPRATPAPPA